MSRTRELYTLTDLAKEYHKDLSYIAKLVKAFELKTIPALQGNHACQALSKTEKVKLEKSNPSLAIPDIAEGEIEINALAKTRKQDVSGLLKLLKRNEFVLEKRLNPNGGRPVNVLSSKEVIRLEQEHPIRIKIK